MKDTNDQFRVPPGEELAQLIISQRQRLPVWRIGPLAAPKLFPPSFPPMAGDYRPYFRPRVLLVLETNDPLAFEQLKPRDRAWLRSMFAALMRDIQGAREEKIVEELSREVIGSGGTRMRGAGFSDERVARRAVEKGRQRWCRLPAWPWCYFSDNGRPPDNWHRHELARDHVEVLTTWLAGGSPTLAA